MTKKAELPDAAKKYFEKAVEDGNALINSIDVVMTFYKKTMAANPTFDDKYSLSTEVMLLKEAKDDVREIVKRGMSFLRYPSKYYKLADIERDETGDYDPDAVRSEIEQYANMEEHNERIRVIIRDLEGNNGSRERTSIDIIRDLESNNDSKGKTSIALMVGQFIGRCFGIFGK